MRTVALCLATAMVAAGCAGDRPTLMDRSEVDEPGMFTESSLLNNSIENTAGVDGPEATDTTTTADEADAPIPSTVVSAQGAVVEAEGGVRALISPAGVVVPVMGQVDNGYVVSTPCGNETFLSWGQPVLQTQVVIDPGHGGDEQGAIGENGLTEAALNLRVAHRVAAELVSQGISVVLTRSGDYRMPITQRAALADAVAAEAFVSVHHNTPSAAPADKPGTEVYVQSGSAESSRLGGLIYEDVIAGLDRFDVEWVARSDAGVLVVLNAAGEDAYGINRRPTVPSALVEVAYLGNPLEARLMESDQYAAAVGSAIASGIEQYLTTTDPGSGFIEQNRTFDPSGATGGEVGCIDPDLE